MKRHEWWREQYNADPYMDGLPSGFIKTRTDDVTANNWYITDDLKLGIVSPRVDDFWMVSWTHLLEEWGKRGGIPGGPDMSKQPKLDLPGLSAAVVPFQASRVAHSEVLVKYSKVDYLRHAIAGGAFKITPASTYDDPSLNVAIRDNELELQVYRRSRLYRLLFDTRGYVLSPVGPKNGYRIEVLKAPTNYYVYCMSTERSLRLFGDFDADAAMIVHNPVKFVRRLGEGVRRILGAGWNWYATPIRYVDPLRAPIGKLDIVESKHFLFTYQREYRIVWVPATPILKLDSFFVRIDPVSDCAELIQLS